MKARIRIAERFLVNADPVLASIIQQHKPCTLMLEPGPRFHTLVWAIINQQLSVKAARSIEARLAQRLCTDYFQPEHFYRIHERTLRNCGLKSKALTPEQRDVDREARLTISIELGHEREAVTAAYLSR